MGRAMLPTLQVVAETVAVPAVLGVRAEFILFGLTLVGVAAFHKFALHVALAGLLAILALKLTLDPSFHFVEHMLGAPDHEGEWRILLNLLGLLLGFAILAKHFEESRIPLALPKYLPDGWKGGFALLAMVFVLSAFLDNIAGAMIGGAMAMVVFAGRVHVGFLAAIVAASNAGGAGSVVGDTTTTMMWIEGVPALEVLPAFIAAIPALLVFGIIGAFQQDRHHPITRNAVAGVEIEWARVVVVALILVGTIVTNVLLDFPAVGVWLAILMGAAFTKTPWGELRHAMVGSVFLLALVLCASMMPVDELPPASWVSTLGLGFVSAIFDNIPLTKLALEQSGYDWAVLAYAVGFGGSMIWFGSSAGVALSNMYPAAKNSAAYLKHGWHVPLAYVVGFFIMLAIHGWQPVTDVGAQGEAVSGQVPESSAREATWG